VTSVDFHARLGDHRLYAGQLERLHEKYLMSRTLYELRQDGVSLASLIQDKTRVARLLAKTVERGEYESQPATIARIETGGNHRVVFAYRLTDLLVHAVVAEIIRDAMAPQLSPGLYSYRKGESWWTAASKCATYLRCHRRQHPDPKDRGVYVLRRDVDAYADSIPVGSQSRIWSMLRAALTPPSSKASIRAADWALLEHAVRPDVETKRGYVSRLLGVATGQPISCVLFNLYLGALDRELDSIPGAFYARYSDDILFAHPDPGVARVAAHRIDEVLAALDLGLSHEKSRNLYLTSAGRPSPAWEEAEGTTVLSFVGTDISAAGTVGLNRRARRSLLRDVEDRALRSAAAVPSGDLDAKGRLVCQVVNRMLDPFAPRYQQQSSASVLRWALTDRRQLGQLDYWIARIVAHAATGDPSPRAFRTLPYRRLRSEWNLLSLEHGRNRLGRRQACAT
jgi:hypothetical protein